MKKIDFLGKRHYAFMLSAGLILLSILVIGLKGLNYGIDFVGGTELVVKTSADLDISDIRRVVEDLRVGDAVIQRFGEEEEGEFLIRIEGVEEAAESKGAALDRREPVTVGAFQDEGPDSGDEAPDSAKAGEGGEVTAAGEAASVSSEEPDGASARGEAADAAPAAGATGEEDLPEPERPAASEVGLRIMEALRGQLDSERREGAFDLNALAPADLALYLEPLVGESERARELAEGIVSYRRGEAGGMLTEWSQLDKMEDLPLDVRPFLEQNAYLGSFVQLKSEVVGPTIGKELRQKALLAIFWSLLGILIYVWFRFELRFSVASIVALIHDVLITVGILALLGQEFSLPMIAALLTIVGYSLNDTIVVFDRVRENIRSMRGVSEIELLNTSLNQTLSRTILTSGTTLLVVICLLLLGGPVIRGFAVALFVGVIVGTYSSIFVASPVVLYWRLLQPQKAAVAGKAAAKSSGKGGGKARGGKR